MMRILRRGLCVPITLLVAMVWHPASVALTLRWVDPWRTQTMWSAVIDQTRKTGRPAWISQTDVRLDDLPHDVPEAILTGEDQRFFEHHGFDWDQISLAWEEHEAGGAVRGASTLSQQVARNVFLWQDRSWVRKGLEAWYTVWLELLVPKRRILEVYLNVAEMGPATFGVEAAARHWYHKSAERLTLSEAASIASLLPAPTSRTPTSPTAMRRADWIVQNRIMLPP